MIINIRGTGGSGKSTVVRRVMEHYPYKTPIYIEGRRQPFYYLLMRTVAGIPHCLTVPGHYETPTGGCDTIQKIDDVYSIINGAALATTYQGLLATHSVIFEGIISQDDVKRAVDLKDRVGAENFLVIVLTTPLDECLKGIQMRRDARGDERPLNPKNTENRSKRVKQIALRLKDAGVKVEYHDRESAYRRCIEVLEL
jgi:predicted kinase